jgi:hypothetical protein
MNDLEMITGGMNGLETIIGGRSGRGMITGGTREMMEEGMVVGMRGTVEGIGGRDGMTKEVENQRGVGIPLLQ